MTCTWRLCQHAAKGGNDLLVHYLIDQGATVNWRDRMGQTARDYASQAKHHKVEGRLMMYGGKYGKDFFSKMDEASGLTTLTLAAAQSDIVQLRSLFAQGYSAHEWGPDGATPLMKQTTDPRLSCTPPRLRLTGS